MRKTSASVEEQVVNLLAVGETQGSVCAQTGVPIPTIKKIRKRNAPLLERIRARATEVRVIQLADVVSRTNRLLMDRLDEVEAQEAELAELCDQYRASNISYAEYRRRKRNLKQLSIRELLAIHNAALKQMVQNRRSSASRH